MRLFTLLRKYKFFINNFFFSNSFRIRAGRIRNDFFRIRIRQKVSDPTGSGSVTLVRSTGPAMWDKILFISPISVKCWQCAQAGYGLAVPGVRAQEPHPHPGAGRPPWAGLPGRACAPQQACRTQGISPLPGASSTYSAQEDRMRKQYACARSTHAQVVRMRKKHALHSRLFVPVDQFFGSALVSVWIRASILDQCGSGSWRGSRYRSTALKTKIKTKLQLEKITIFLIKNCNLLIYRPPLRASKLQEKPSAIKREHPTLQNLKFFPFFLFLGAIFALLDLDTDLKNGHRPFMLVSFMTTVVFRAHSPHFMCDIGIFRLGILFFWKIVPDTDTVVVRRGDFGGGSSP